MDNFSGAVATRLKQLAENYISKFKRNRKPKESVFYDETLLHLHHCKSLNASFAGVSVEHQLTDMQKLLTNGAKNEHYAIMVKGPPCSGKSMFLSKLCCKAREMFGKDTVLITRYVGLTSASTSCEDVLRAICNHLNKLLQQNLSLKSYNMSKLRNYFHGLLNRVSKGKRHVVLAVDSIDKMRISSSEADPNAALDWIVSKLPAKVHFVVSYNTCPLTPAVERLDGKAMSDDHKITFPDSTEEEIKSTIQSKLKSKMRALGKEQETLFRGLLPRSRSPLVTSLLLEKACRMPSHYPPAEMTAAISTDELVSSRLARIEQTVGAKPVRALCRYITLAKEGLSEVEILDLLSCNNDLLLEIYPQDIPKILRFPFQTWLHIKDELGKL